MVNLVGNSSLEKSRPSGNPSLHFSTTAWTTGIHEMPEYMHGERSDLKQNKISMEIWGERRLKKFILEILSIRNSILFRKMCCILNKCNMYR